MKGSLIVVAFFCIGCVVGTFNDSQLEVHNLLCTCFMPLCYRSVSVLAVIKI